jgi:hypothetical protein
MRRQLSFRRLGGTDPAVALAGRFDGLDDTMAATESDDGNAAFDLPP